MRVEWTAPFDNSDEIIAYLIEAQEQDGDWTEICDGTDPTVVATQRCIQDMNVFVDPATFNLAFEDTVYVRVSAENVNGVGDVSVPNVDGAYVRTAPSYMNAPQRDGLTNDH